MERNGWFFVKDKEGKHPLGSDWSIPCHYRQVWRIRNVARGIIKSNPRAYSVYWVSETEFRAPEWEGTLICTRD